MDLPNLFSSTSAASNQPLVLCVFVSDSKLQVGLLELSKSGVELLELSREFSYENQDQCIEKVDLALQQLSEQSEQVSETIFAVGAPWVKDGELSAEKKPLIKRITKDLNLQALGFIEMNEALAEQKIIENALFSGILAIFSEFEVSFTLVYQGKFFQTEVVGISSDFAGDFTEAVARLHKTIEKSTAYLPSKIFLASFELSQPQLSEYQQKIYDQNWQEHTAFLQTPVVEIVTQAHFLEYLAREAGKNAAAYKGLTDIALAASLKKQDDSLQLDPQEVGFSDSLSSSLSSQESDDQAFGELEEKPAKQHSAQQELPELAVTRETARLTKKIADGAPTSFGIPITSSMDLSKTFETQETAVDDLPVTSAAQTPQLAGLHKKTDWGHKKNLKWFIASGVVLGLVCLYALVAFGAPVFAKTTVAVVLDTKVVAKDITLTLDTNAEETDIEKLLIKADTVTKKVTGKSTMPTTGITVVGEKAKGTVAVYNKTSANKTFEKGTLLKFQNLTFALDEEIVVASVSAKQNGEEYGRKDVAVTASQIGAESNIVKDSELGVASFDSSSYNAFVISDGLTGGSSREVRVVAQKDLDELKTDLTKELLEQANKEFSDESGNGTYILPSKSVTNTKTTYSNKVDSEAESVSLELEIDVEAVTYSGADLKPVAQEILSKEVPEGYELLDQEPQILSSPSITDIEALESEAVVSIQANISSYAVAKLSSETVLQTIAGKSFDQATEALVTQHKVKQVEFSVTPSFLSSFVKKVSQNQENILVTFTKK